MIAKITPGLYRQATRQISRPSPKRYPFFQRPMGLYLSQPVHTYGSIEEIRTFLLGCRYISDQEQFGVRDHWMPPEEIERVRQGDCDDFALWTWRQLFHLGYRTRFVCGLSGRYGAGHAWVTFELNGDWYLVEPLAARAGRTIPRLLVRRYKPYISVEASGKQVKFFEHLDSGPPISLGAIAPLIPELAIFYIRNVWAWACWLGKKIVHVFRRSASRA